MNYSFVTESIILLAWGFTPWFAFYLFKTAKHSDKKTMAITFFITLWSIYSLNAVLYKFDALPGPLQQIRPIVYLLTCIILVWLFRWKIVGSGLSQNLLLGLQIFRLIGVVFLIEHYRGNLPGIFAHPAGWGDLLVGLLALYVTIKFYNKDIPNFWVKTVLILGVIDFVSAFFFGFTSSQTPFQLFAFDAPNSVIEYPTGIIPIYLVPYAFAAHILSWTEMNRKNKAISF